MPNSQSGVRVCAPDMFKFDMKSRAWNNIQYQNPSGRKMIGRKNYAVSSHGGLIFMSGGKDANSDLIADFLRFDDDKSCWEYLELSSNRRRKAIVR